MDRNELIKEHAEIDRLLTRWRGPLHKDFRAYRGHVYRVFNYCRVLAKDRADSDSKIAIAAVFHDMGIWSDKTFDYLEPSVALAREYLKESQRSSWKDEVSRMILYHHKVHPYREKDGRLVEAFRRADLVDLTRGGFKFGLDPLFIRKINAEFPNAGFHRRVLQLSLQWALRHPLNPLPMVKR